MEGLNTSNIKTMRGSQGTSSVPIEHMDYSYIKECNDIKQLEKILAALRSGNEGHYPDLIQFCERRIETVDPKSKSLRKDKPPASMYDVDKEEWKQINSDVKDWASNMSKEPLASSAPSGSLANDDDSLPHVRKPFNLNTKGKQVKNEDWGKPSADRIKTADYRAWDKYDADGVSEGIDNSNGMEKPKKPESVDSGIASNINTEGMSDSERELVANKEKDKGNEAFKAGDFDEAAQYYTRSISVIPSAPSYNNRSLARIKLGQFTGAVADCTKVLELEPENIKAFLRRGTARKSLKEFKLAKEDLEAVLRVETNNKQAKDLLADIASKKREQKKATEKAGPANNPKTGGRRMVIQEVEDDSDSDEEHDGIGQTSSGTGSTNSDVKLNGPTTVVDGNVASNPSNDASVQQNQDGGSVAMATPPPAKSLPGDVVALKDYGNQLFKTGQYGEAREQYSLAIKKILPEKEAFSSALATLHSNRSACHSKTGNLKETINDCDEALEIQPYNVKVLLRRAAAYETLEKFRNAYIDFQSALKIETFNQSAQSGSNRMLRVLSDLDGPQWREKLPPSPSTLGLPLPPPILTTMAPSNASVPSVTSTTNVTTKPAMTTSVRTDPRQDQKASGQVGAETTEAAKREEKTITESGDKTRSGDKAGSQVKPKADTKSESKASADPELTAEAKFLKLKAEGNAFVNQSKFRQAIECYTACIALDPEQIASYTNRALCFLKVNKENEAESDCTRALEINDANIKALYRRALARKVLLKYSDSARDLKSLLKIEPNNGSAKKELEQVKEKWRQELKNTQQKTADEKPKEMTQPPSQKAKPSEVKPSEVKPTEVKPTEVKPTEVKPTEVKPTEVKPTEVKPTEVKPTEVKPMQDKAKQGKQTKSTETKPGVKPGMSEVKPGGKPGVSEVKQGGKPGGKSGKKKGKRMQIQEIQEGSSEEENNPGGQKPADRANAKDKKGNKMPKDTGSQKGGQKVGQKGSQNPGGDDGRVTVPKLTKMTAYEFLQAWTSLKRNKSTQAYAELLKQVSPRELPEVLTNKLDGDMLVNIVKAVCEHLVASDGDLSYGFLANLPKVERFKTVLLFMSVSDKKRLRNSLKKLGALESEVFSESDLQNLSQQYGL